uniref:SGNH hydrolase domain-containing protein n=1 Tax=Yersinia proxima TaxID=2890316 RepID=UPI001D106975
ASSSWANKGWVWRLPEQIQKINDFDLPSLQKYVGKTQRELTNKRDFKNNGKEKILIVGDSQSADIMNIMSEVGVIDKYDIIALSINTRCRSPYVNKSERQKFWTAENPVVMNAPNLIPECERQMDSFMDEKILSKADKIFISMKWASQSIPKMKNTIAAISELSTAKIYLFGNKNLSKSSIDLVNLFGRINNINEYASKFRDVGSDKVNESIAKIPGTTFVDMMKLTCPEVGSCNVLTKDLKPIFFDTVHLTREGAIYLGMNFLKILSDSDNYNKLSE